MVIFKRYRVPVMELQKYVNPLSGWLWGCAPIAPSEIVAAVAAQQFEEVPWDRAKDRLQGPAGRDFHIGRIAYFVANGLPSDGYAVQIDLDLQPDDREIGIVNGNHRIAAAILRGDAQIDATVYFFDAAEVARLLPGSIEL
jgi:hypothetical protein